jgi:hypothetical protein
MSQSNPPSFHPEYKYLQPTTTYKMLPKCIEPYTPSNRLNLLMKLQDSR